MPILALDTATLVSSVAIAKDNQLLAEITLQTKLTHSEVLMPHVKQAMDMAKLTRADLQAVAVSIGPGSFTGLRIGLATAKSLAYALKAPLYGISTLAALACHYPVPGIYIAPMLDAQKGNVYISLYTWENGALNEVYAPCVKSAEEAFCAGRTLDRPVVFVGEGAVKYQAMMREHPKNFILPKPHLVMPRAANVAMLGLKRLQSGEADDVMTLEPLYIRRSEAEVLWEKRNGGMQ